MGSQLSVEDWHARFSTQASWSKQLRSFLYKQIGIQNNSRILEVGSGTGIITSELKEWTEIAPSGVDFDFNRTWFSHLNDPFSHYACADVYALPYTNNSFDFILSHYFFLWLKDPLKAGAEIFRALKPGGIMLALAEPDYQSRIDTPNQFIELGLKQNQALSKQGADIMMGRKLPSLFSKMGFKHIQFGVSGFQQLIGDVPEWFESEWKMIMADLEDEYSVEELFTLKQLDLNSRKNGERVLWIPTFYIFGTKS